jgi:restriction endonuclease S subunit
MKKTLQEIAEIKAGYLFKECIQPESDGNVSVVQLKDIDSRGVLNTQQIQKVNLEKLNNDDLLSNGDILLKAKTNYPAAAVVSDISEKTIATAHYFVIRLKTNEVRPGFLAWYLNQKPAQNYFEKNAGGTRIRVINKQLLSQLEVALPDIETQMRIEKVFALQQREHDLLDSIKEKRRAIVSAKLLSKVSGQGG